MPGRLQESGIHPCQVVVQERGSDYQVPGNYKQLRPEPSLDAVECSHAALFCFMNAHTLENAILSAVNLGGDADTIGACCGALAGSYWGIDTVPERWIRVLDGVNEIVQLADALWQVRKDKFN